MGKNFLVEYSASKVGALRRQAGSPVNCEQAGKLGDSWHDFDQVHHGQVPNGQVPNGPMLKSPPRNLIW